MEARIDTVGGTLRAVADVMPLMVAAVDRDGAYLYVNHVYARFFGMRAEEFAGKCVDDVSALPDPQFDQDARIAAVRRCIDTGAEIEDEATVCCPDGRTAKLLFKLIGDPKAGICYGFLSDAGTDPLAGALERQLIRALAKIY